MCEKFYALLERNAEKMEYNFSQGDVRDRLGILDKEFDAAWQKFLVRILFHEVRSD